MYVYLTVIHLSFRFQKSGVYYVRGSKTASARTSPDCSGRELNLESGGSGMDNNEINSSPKLICTRKSFRGAVFI